MEKEYFISYVQSDAYSAAFSVIRDGEEPYTPDSLDYAFYDETGKQLDKLRRGRFRKRRHLSYRVYRWKNETFFPHLFYNDPNEDGRKGIFSAQIRQICARDIFGVDRYSRTNLISLGYSFALCCCWLCSPFQFPALLAAFITLMCGFRARRPNTENRSGALNRIPFDVLFLVCVSPVFAVFVVISSSFQ